MGPFALTASEQSLIYHEEKLPNNVNYVRICMTGYNRTWCQILCTMRLQCVSKILTPPMMLQKTCLIAKINLWTNSFQNMYDML